MRERVQDILPLPEFFVAKFAACLNKPIDFIPDEVVEILKAYDWPGNIRELQNLIERAVLFSPGSVLRLPLDLKQTVKQSSESASRTLPTPIGSAPHRQLADEQCHAAANC